MGCETSEETMGLSCQEVWRDISDYIDDDLDPIRRRALDQHFVECRRCTALLDGTRNVISLYRDERVLAPPDGFHERLYQRLGQETKRSRRSFLAWTLTAAAAVPLGLAGFFSRGVVVAAPDAASPPAAPRPPPPPAAGASTPQLDHNVFHVRRCR